jgi:hypothetical protein
MGVESMFYILPDDSGYRPEPTRVCQLVRALQTAGFLCDPKSPSFVAPAHAEGPLGDQADYEGFIWKVRPGPDKHAGSLTSLERILKDLQDSDVVVKWPNSDLNVSGLKYPLTLVPESEGVHYAIEIHLAAQTVYHASEIIDPYEEIRCRCGKQIQQIESSGSTPLYDPRLPNHCPSCHEPINYATMSLTIRDGFTGAESKTVGGAVYRFAVVVDCGKYWPDGEAQVTAGFLGVVESSLNVRARVIRDFY